MKYTKILFAFVALLIFGFCVFLILNSKKVEVEKVESEKEKEVIEVKQEGAGATATLLFVGDIMLSRGVEYVAPRYKNPLFPFHYIASTTAKYDLAIGNLETPITKKGPYMVPYSLVFNSDPKYLRSLKLAGFDILSSANNHALDKGEAGLLETIKFIRDSGMESVGAGEDCHKGIIKEVDGIIFGFLAYSYTGHNSGGHAPNKLVCDWQDFENVKTDVQNLKKKVDHVIILPHTGVEYSKVPTKEDVSKMKELVDLGASAVIGAHPHVVQGVEEYKNGVIAYSLGNFVFDNQENPETEKGLALVLTFTKKSLQDIEKINIKIKNFCCPEMQKK